VQVLSGEMRRQDLQQAVGLKDDEHFRKYYLLPALVFNIPIKSIKSTWTKSGEEAGMPPSNLPG